MNTNTADQITEVRNRIATAESDTAASTEADRAKLADLERQAQAEAEAENTRRAARRLAWARHYLQTRHTAEAGDARKATTAARREFERVLAAQPWVTAMLEWQGAIDAEHAVALRAVHARRLTGTPATEPTPPANVLPMSNSEVSFTPIGRVLHYLADSLNDYDAAAEVDTLAAATEGDADPLAAALTATGTTKADPLAWIARDGSRLDVVQHHTDDGPQTMHRNPNTDEWVMTDQTGRVTATSWTTAAAQGRTSNPIDGSEFGSVLDPETGKFVKQRVN
ncbi:hypothetical protein FB459_1276 [Yimella lutea]|uniref:Uncharacterized protein n=1 Tax=Yimella lutea TaxID=587872 RepID=A0A542EET7_9MICO|nr:hypothetical protein [Yimella lutea]TQJ13841.1 hypothetical protein FB459_1276 [Yimella lutea]